MSNRIKNVAILGLTSGALLLTACGSHTADDALMGGAAGAGAGALIGGAGTGAVIGSGQDKQDRREGTEYQNPLD